VIPSDNILLRKIYSRAQKNTIMFTVTRKLIFGVYKRLYLLIHLATIRFVIKRMTIITTVNITPIL